MKPDRDYLGKRAWAEAWACALQSRVGTHIDGRIITEIRAQGYGETYKQKRPRWWCVVELWQYEYNPSLGTFGEENALMLETRMPP